MGALVEDPVLRQRYRFERRVGPDDEPYVEVVWCEPGGGGTPHAHPTQSERFEILEGVPSSSAAGRGTSSGRETRSTCRRAPGTRSANRGGATVHFPYRASTVLGLLPVAVQRLLLDPLVPIAERRGLRAGRMAQALGV